MEEISLKALLEAGCHFGHKADRWHPKAARFIYQEREGIHVIDLVKTKAGLQAAAEFVKAQASDGKTVLFVGTKRQAAPIIREEAARVGAPFIGQRWIGGFLTNWSEIHKNLEKIRRLTEEEKTNAWKKFPKHERVKLSRYLKKLNFLYGGVVQLTQPPDAFFVVDIKKERVAVFEARKMNVPVVGVVDTNADPDWVDYVIPSNDDAVGAVQFIIHYIAEAYKEGLELRQKTIEKENKIKESKIEEEKKATDAVKTKTVEPVSIKKEAIAAAEPKKPTKKATAKPGAKTATQTA